MLNRVLEPGKKSVLHEKNIICTPKRRVEDKSRQKETENIDGREKFVSPKNLLQGHTHAEISSSENASRNEFRKLVLSKLNTLLKKSDQIEERLIALEQLRQNKADDDVESDEEGIGIPLTNLAELDDFEEKIKTNSDYSRKLINVLKRSGGSDVNSIIYGIMRQLLTNSLAQKFSWVGFKGKKNFKELRLAKLITKTVRIHKNTITDDVIAEAISKWLAQAQLRASREEMRANKNKSNNSVEESDEN
ncbi:unnamed protein product [Phaedon cochleariae]|uniref:DUF4806 domain-containing protein n=1 Tax=Phaedon cochleariae TaxID=80249 RepID=A0A9N9X4A3_PHACE|nr:unnamed protein product [Phaedon cochleariae]